MKNKIFLKIKPFQETLHKGYCGAASLKIVLAYYKIEASEAELAKMMVRKGADLGNSASDIKKAAESFGFKVRVKNSSSYKDVLKWLEKGVPVIVDWFTRGRNDYDNGEVADGHYSVVAGMDEEFIYLQDPEIGKIRKIDKDDFMKVWFDFEGRIINPSELIIRQIIAIYKRRI